MTVLEVDRLSKLYRLGVVGAKTLREDMQRWWARLLGRPDPLLKVGAGAASGASGDRIWALKDVSLKVSQGEVLGIIGRNGAGKSTLLKVLSRVTAPFAGEVRIRGRTGSLLEVGTGFHGELTGRENVYLNGLILGMTKAEVDRRFDEIVDFAGVGPFVDTPIKRYSSGMKVRLGFAVAAHLQPEILIIDEVLAVGDADFQRRCLGKMGDIAQEGRTILFVSHNMTSIQVLCTRAIQLERGEIVSEGKPDRVVRDYLGAFGQEGPGSGTDLSDAPRSAGFHRAIADVWLEDEDGSPVGAAQTGAPVSICFRFEVDRVLPKPYFGLGVEDDSGRRIFSISNQLLGKPELRDVRSGTVAFRFPKIPLLPGDYWLSLSVVDATYGWVDYVERATRLEVAEGDVFGTGRLPQSSQGIVVIDGSVELRTP